MNTNSNQRPHHDPLEFFDEEITWSKQLRSIDCGLEIIKLMGYTEAKDFLESKITELLKNRAKNNRAYRKLCRLVYSRVALTNDEAGLTIDLIWCGTGMGEDMKNQERLNELVRYWRASELRRPEWKHSSINRQQLLERAKAFPIEQLYLGNLRNSCSRLTGLCPFHEERTPSFYIFPDSNTHHCFGCSAHGDSVSFYMRLHKCDFNQALTVLGEQ